MFVRYFGKGKEAGSQPARQNYTFHKTSRTPRCGKALFTLFRLFLYCYSFTRFGAISFFLRQHFLFGKGKDFFNGQIILVVPFIAGGKRAQTKKSDQDKSHDQEKGSHLSPSNNSYIYQIIT
jgi:hypothetical protein